MLVFASCKKNNPDLFIGKISQSSIEAPTCETVIEKKIPEITWKRNVKGIYQGDFKSELTGKYYAEIEQPANLDSRVSISINSEYVQIYSEYNGEFSDDQLIQLTFKIYRYK